MFLFRFSLIILVSYSIQAANAATSVLEAFDEQSKIEAEIGRKSLTSNLKNNDPERRQLVQEKWVPAQQKTQNTIQENTAKLLDPNTYGMKTGTIQNRKIASETKRKTSEITPGVEVNPKTVPKIYHFPGIKNQP